MKKKVYLLFAISLFFLLHSEGMSADGKSGISASRPNIVFIMADDMGYGDLGCYGATDIKTPHIDSICKQGVKFTDFHVHPRCTPTRGALLTGCYANRTGVSRVIYANDAFGINSAERTFPELLKEKGYTCGIVGKWHLGDREPFWPLHHGFDFQFIRLRVIDAEKLEKAGENESKQRGAYNYQYNKNGAMVDYSAQDLGRTELYTTHAVEFIHENKNQPFVLYFAHNIPHVPLEPSAAFKGTSDRGKYGDCVQEMDASVGNVLKTLDELKLTENTLVIFCSDNGPQFKIPNTESGGNAGSLRDGKWTTFEGGTRTPFLARWPGKIKPGSQCDDLIGIIDMLPTFCALTGAAVPTDRVIDGVDVSSSLLGCSKDHPPRETFAYFDGGGCFAFRYKQWKLFVKDEDTKGSNAKVVKTGKAKAGELFNLEEDLSETTDVSAEHPELVLQIKKMADQFLSDFRENSRPLGRIE